MLDKWAGNIDCGPGYLALINSISDGQAWFQWTTEIASTLTAAGLCAGLGLRPLPQAQAALGLLGLVPSEHSSGDQRRQEQNGVDERLLQRRVGAAATGHRPARRADGSRLPDGGGFAG